MIDDVKVHFVHVQSINYCSAFAHKINRNKLSTPNKRERESEDNSRRIEKMHHGLRPFMVPVDEPGYLEVIEKPMDIR